SVQYITVNIRISNAGSEASPATNLYYLLGPSPTYPSAGAQDLRSVPSLASGASETDSWRIVPTSQASALPPGACKTLSIWLDAAGRNVNVLLIHSSPPSVQAQVCNT